MDIDKLILLDAKEIDIESFGSLMDIDKLIPGIVSVLICIGFGSLMDIDKLIPSKICGRADARFWFSDGY